jgi:transcriptional regulator with XRE-family HTH domain
MIAAALAARLAAWRARPLPAGLPGRVRELRELHDWTQADLAIVAGLSPNGVRQIEAGRRRPSLKTARRLAAALGVAVDELTP